MRRSNFSFRTHLAVLGLITAVPFIVGGAAISFLYVSAERAQTERQLVNSAKDIVQSVDRELEGAMAALRTLALSPSLADGDYRTFQGQAIQAAQLFPGGSIVLRRSDGQQMVNTAREWGANLARSEDPVILAADQAALEGDRSSVSGLFTGTSSGDNFVAVVIPVTAAGAPHFINLALPPSGILQLVRGRQLLPPDWLVIVLDRSFRVIARTVDNEKFVGVRATLPFSSRLIQSEGTLRSRTLDGVDVVNGYYKSPLSGWTVIVAVPLVSFNQPFRNALVAVGSIAALGLIASILFAFAYGRYLTPPIWRLRGDALALAQRKSIEPFRTGVRELNAVSEAIAYASEALFKERESNRLLINELNHRVKNTLATVQAIASQAMRRSTSLTVFNDAFTGRLLALSKSHDALSDTGWVSVGFRDLVKQVCGATADETRITMDGPAVALAPKVALALGLVLHELCTNAAKYGALSTEGHVRLTWTTAADAALLMEWHESGGPVVSPPDKAGFGTGFIRRTIERDLDGTVDFRFLPTGLIVVARFPTVVGNGLDSQANPIAP